MSNYKSKCKCPDCKRPLTFIDEAEGYYHCPFCKQDYDSQSVEE